MPLLRLGDIIENNWIALEEGESPPQGSNVMVTFDRLVTDAEILAKHNGAVGVSFPNDRPIEDLQPYLEQLDVVQLVFPVFGDGRAYSQARALRNQLGYPAEIRASGNVLPDQLAYMRQCGFDAFDIAERHDAQAWQSAATAMTVAYQRGYGPQRGFAPENALDQRKERFND